MRSKKSYVITGPTSGIGYETALELSKYGTIVLVGRNPEKLAKLQKEIQEEGRTALWVVCDVSDMESVKRASQEIVALNLPITGLLNNAGIMPSKASKSAQGWDLTYATNYLGSFMLTELLLPHLAARANVLFVGSAIEDAERKAKKAMGMKGGRYLSAEASARGEWKAGGTKMGGMDAYATSKQCVLAAGLALSRENQHVNVNVIEPGITPGTGIGDTPFILRFLFSRVLTLLPPFAKHRSTPKKAAAVIAKILTNASGKTGIYYDENGQPMLGSKLVQDQQFQDRILAETRALLAPIGSLYQGTTHTPE